MVSPVKSPDLLEKALIKLTEADVAYSQSARLKIKGDNLSISKNIEARRFCEDNPELNIGDKFMYRYKDETYLITVVRGSYQVPPLFHLEIEQVPEFKKIV